MSNRWYESPPDSEYDGPDPGFPDEPEPPTMQQMPPVRATIYHRRKPAELRQLAPYLAALVGVGVAVAVLMLSLTWKAAMQAQVNELRHEVVAAQSQAASGDATLNQALSGVSRHVADVRAQVGSLSSQLGPFAAQCTTDMTGPAGVAAYVVPCRR